ncbi:glycogen synthase [Formosa sp. L2A11]|uniref:glycogen synthase n=1 Tax=Formosa sp. L2A11 TaxID=2686363 RepID=UPI00131E8D6D|nr:glycogen/starch synthase [Formosa sp. L2A11]
MIITHLSAECYPIAKVGGLADVLGALPKYQNELGATSQVVMPFYKNEYTQSHCFEAVYNDTILLGETDYDFRILTLKDHENDLGFKIFFVDVPELLYTDFVYTSDDTERFLAFQIAALDWIAQSETIPDVIHCHDHHTGLIPFMMQESFRYSMLRKVAVAFTIHNAQYQGWFSHDLVGLIPEFKFSHVGLLDWNHCINPMASAIKCAWVVTTVSPNYMDELELNANGLESLLSDEHAKCIGILNGIDTKVWNTETDPLIIENYTQDTIYEGKFKNKQWLCNKFNLDVERPLIAFIGRLVEQKGADLFPKIFSESLFGNDISILLLGSGEKHTENDLINLKEKFPDKYNAYIGYDEKLSHIIYAGADFLLMPSRVEPCGLNQMYALRYGTIPIVNSVGGLKDTVEDLYDGGFGICHNGVTVSEVCEAIERATEFYDSEIFKQTRVEVMSIDHSWHASAESYLNVYNSLNPFL